MTVTEVNDFDQFKQIIQKDKITVFDFWAEWCGPCKFISPIFETLSGNFPSIEFYKVDVDKAEKISQEAGIRAMPTFQVYKDGKKIDDLVGANPGGLQTLISKHVEAV